MFMHELGHNLSLRHGGFEDGRDFRDAKNWKPNYRSIMGYLYGGERGVDVDGDGHVPDDWAGLDLRINYSEEQVNLDERSLNESLGITGKPEGPAIDFNCDGRIEEAVRQDIQCEEWAPPDCDCGGTKEQVLGYDDWRNLVLFKNPHGGEGGGEPETAVCPGITEAE